MSPRRGVAVIVAYYAPPAIGIAVQRLRGFLRFLPEVGWDPVLIAPAAVHYHRTVGGEGAEDALADVQVVRVHNPEPSRWLRRLAGRGGTQDPSAESVVELRPVETGRVGARVREFVRSWVYVPDAQALWIPRAGRAAVHALQAAEGHPRVLFSSSDPFSCHMAARTAAAETGVPWVAEYRDPWSLAPLYMGHRPRLRQIIDDRLDREVMDRADHLTVTSERTRRLFLEEVDGLAPAGVTVVRNGWDEIPDGKGFAPPSPSAPLTLAYAGSLARASWALPLLEGVAMVLAREPGSVFVDVFGSRERWQEATGLMGGDVSFLRLHGLVPGAEVPRRLREASASVVLFPENGRSDLYVPGKVYDCIGARRPVLSDVPPGSEPQELMSRFGDLRSFAGRGAEGVAEVVGRLLSEHRAGSLESPSVPSGVVEALSRRAQASVLGQVMDGVARR